MIEYFLLPITVKHYMLLAFIIFAIGMMGAVINRKHLVAMLISIELMLLATGINFVAISAYTQNITGQIFAIFVLALAAAEMAVGLAILLVYFRNKKSISVNSD